MRRPALVPAALLLLAGCSGVNLGPISTGDVIKAGTAVAASQREFTPEEEQQLGRVVAARVLGTYPLWEDTARTRYLNLVGQVVARQVGRPGTVWHFALLDTGTVNAFSGPGGYVFVTRGLFQSCRSEAELAAVLAHECGHVAGQHVLTEIKRTNLITTGVSIVADHAGGGGLTADLMRQIGEKGADVLINRGMSRKDEYDADARGCRIAHGAGYATVPYEEFLLRLAVRMEAESGGSLASIAKTHPGPADRATKLQAEGLIFADGQTLADRFARLGK
ncbi:MAG: M48 family metalloprotease [Thermoanaerobaculaceae bacterium]|nr:M48 family metalloprotease [Thermoanaerobaculaceae bacterium]